MAELAADVLAAVEELGTVRQAMVTLSFNPHNGNRGWMASISHGRAIGFGPTPAGALVDLQGKLRQEDQSKALAS